MTGCLYISPWITSDIPELGVVPLLLADTVASYRRGFRPQGSVPLSPATISRRNLDHTSSISIVRKLHLIGDAAVALAGKGEMIASALHELRQHMPELRGQERPMRWLGDAANRANELHGPGTLDAIGICALPDGRVNTMTAYECRQLKHLGMCSAIGSGTTEIWKLVEAIEESIDRWPPTHGMDKAVQCASAINAKRLVQELRGEQAPDHWGGFLEWAVMDQKGKWHRGPRETHLFMEGVVQENCYIAAFLVQRAIGYDPVGRILSMEADANFDFMLENEPTSEKERTSIEEFWSDWRPEVVTVTIFTRHAARNGNITESFYGKSIEHIRFVGAGKGRSFGLPPDIFDHMGESLAKSQGLKYQPLTPDRIVDVPA